MIALAKVRNLEPVREAAKEIVEKFADYIDRMVADPKQFTSHTLFSVEMPAVVYSVPEGEAHLFKFIREMIPADYAVEKSHDGGGMYSTVVIGWKEQPANPRIPTR